MFEASLNQMALASEDLRKISKELNSCLSDTYGPSGFLQELSYMENPLRRIKKVQKKLDEKVAQTIQMRMTLEQICEQYKRSENDIMDFCEEAAIMARRREQVAFSSIGWVSDRISVLIS